MLKEKFQNFKDSFIKAVLKETDAEKSIIDRGTQLEVIGDNGEKQMVNLDNLFQRHLHGESIEHLIETVVKPIISNNFYAKSEKSWEEVKSSIYPQLKNIQIFEDAQMQKAKMVHSDDIIPFIAVCYVIDVDDYGVVYITEDHLVRWEVDKDTLHKQAMENLKPKAEDIRRIDSQGSFFFVSQTNDAYDASRILALNYDTFKEEFEGEVLIGIPNRDFIIIFDSAQEYVPFFFMNVIQDYQNRPYGIIPAIYLWDGKEYKPTQLKKVD